MKTALFLCGALILCLSIARLTSGERKGHAQDSVIAVAPLAGRGHVNRQMLTRNDLFGSPSLPTPVDDTAALAFPRTPRSPPSLLKAL